MKLQVVEVVGQRTPNTWIKIKATVLVSRRTWFFWSNVIKRTYYSYKITTRKKRDWYDASHRPVSPLLAERLTSAYEEWRNQSNIVNIHD